MMLRTRFASVSLRWQICVLLAGALLTCVVTMGTLAYWRCSQVITDLTLDQVMSETRVAAEQLEDAVTSTRVDLISIPTFPPIQGLIRCWDHDGQTDPLQEGATVEVWKQRLAEILISQMRAHPWRRSCAVYDASGNSVLQVDAFNGRFEVTTESQESAEHATFFPQVRRLNQGQTYVEPMQRVSDQVRLRLATPFFAKNSGDFRGALLISLDGREILQEAADRILSGSVQISDETGMYLYDEDPAKPFRPERYTYAADFPVRAKLMQSTEASSDTYKSYVARDEVTRVSLLASYQKVYFDRDDRSRFWVVSSSVEAATALRPATDLARSVTILGLIVLAVTGLVAFVLLGRLTQPLQNLTKVANRIAAGDLTTALPTTPQRGEIQALYRSIAGMTANLHKLIGAAKAEQARTRAIFNSTADAIVTIDEQGQILSCNATTERLFGSSEAKLLGQKASVLVPSLYEDNAQYDRHELAPGEARQVGPEAVVDGYHKSGKVLPIAMRVTEVEHAGERLYIATMQDISARKHAEDEREALFTAIRDAVNRLAAGTRQILATTTEQSAGAQQQAAAVSETVATVEEVSHTAEQAAQRAQAVADAAKQADEVGRAGRKAVDDSVSSMEAVRVQVQSIAENILSLAERAQAIGEIIATVSDIAEQTNVLALNAAVEASRAGEQGRGFAVVASEVKALAAQSKKATTQVRQILGEIQQAMNTAVLSTEKGTASVTQAAGVVSQTGGTIKRLEEMLSHTARTAAQISASAGQQATGVIQLNEAIKNIDRVTHQNVQAIQQIEESAYSLDALSNELAGLTAE